MDTHTKAHTRRCRDHVKWRRTDDFGTWGPEAPRLLIRHPQVIWILDDNRHRYARTWLGCTVPDSDIAGPDNNPWDPTMWHPMQTWWVLGLPALAITLGPNESFTVPLDQGMRWRADPDLSSVAPLSLIRPEHIDADLSGITVLPEAPR